MSSQDRKVTRASGNTTPRLLTDSEPSTKDWGQSFKSSHQTTPNEMNRNSMLQPSQVNQRNRDGKAQRRVHIPSANNAIASSSGGEINRTPRVRLPNREQRPVVGDSPGTSHIKPKPVPRLVPSSSSRLRNPINQRGTVPVSHASGPNRTGLEAEIDGDVDKVTPPLSTSTHLSSSNTHPPISCPGVKVTSHYVDRSVRVNVEIVNHTAHLVHSVSVAVHSTSVTVHSITVTVIEGSSCFGSNLSSPRPRTTIPVNVVYHYVDHSVHINFEIANHAARMVYSLFEQELRPLQSILSVPRRLVNAKYGNVAFLPNANSPSDVVASDIDHKPGEKWRIRKASKNGYYIQNATFGSYAGAQLDSVVGKAEIQDQWILRPTRVPGTYTISPSTNTDVYWALEDGEFRTPITLQPGSSNPAHHWRLE